MIEVKLFKTWIIPRESSAFGNLAIKNTGTAPILLAKDVINFEIAQLDTHLANSTSQSKQDPTRDTDFKMYVLDDHQSFELQSGETHVYEGRKLYFDPPWSEKPFVVSIYQGKGFWLDSEPLNVSRVTPDSEEFLADINDGLNFPSIWTLVTVTYKNERWLYKKSLPRERNSGGNYYAVCPLSFTNKIRVEPHQGHGIYKIWDGENPMIFDIKKSMLLEGPDEHNVWGKWTRERKQQAEADNAEVRRKKQEAQ